jgi:hypothetical protein
MAQCTVRQQRNAGGKSMKRLLGPIWSGVLIYSLTSSIAVGGVIFGNVYVRPYLGTSAGHHNGIQSFVMWDGLQYQHIAEHGYSYNPNEGSNIAFFPAFPLAARVLGNVAGWPTKWALMAVAHGALICTFVVFAAYLGARSSVDGDEGTGLALVVFGLWPTTFFFRMAYSESLFVLAAMSLLYSIERRWPLIIAAAICGAATATRPVGVALVPLLIVATWQRASSKTAFAWRLAWVLPISIWGLSTFVLYQSLTFGNPLAFVQTQANWRMRAPAPPIERMESLAILEPVWSVYAPTSPCYWGNDVRNPYWLFNLRLANPLYFVAAVLLLIVGKKQRLLNTREMMLGSGLLLIPYITRSYEMCFCSMGRFSAVAVPIYIVLGHLLWRLPPGVAAALLAVSGLLMALYAALFGAGYPMF